MMKISIICHYRQRVTFSFYFLLEPGKKEENYSLSKPQTPTKPFRVQTSPSSAKGEKIELTIPNEEKEIPKVKAVTLPSKKIHGPMPQHDHNKLPQKLLASILESTLNPSILTNSTITENDMVITIDLTKNLIEEEKKAENNSKIQIDIPSNTVTRCETKDLREKVGLHVIFISFKL